MPFTYKCLKGSIISLSQSSHHTVIQRSYVELLQEDLLSCHRVQNPCFCNQRIFVPPVHKTCWYTGRWFDYIYLKLFASVLQYTHIVHPIPRAVE
jgi:hypothetical protein